MPRISLDHRLAERRPLLLDGPMGTELARRGVSTETPLWSASALLTAPEVVEQIHRDYVVAGAEIITANTFRTHVRNLGQLPGKVDARGLTQAAVSTARKASGETAWIAGSMAPLEDCYRPDLTPSQRELEREHALMAANLANANVDLFLVETHPTIRESAAAAKAAKDVGLPVLVSWVCGRDGRLLSGESLKDAAFAILPIEPTAILVNCLAAATAEAAVHELIRAAGAVPVGIYANTGWSDAQGKWVQGAEVDPAVYAEQAARWLDAGARIVGGCCGTTPEHIARLRQLIDDAEFPGNGDR